MRERNWGELAVFSGLAGAASSAVKTLVHHLFEWLNIAEPLYTQINAFLIHGHATVRGVGDIFMTEIGDLVIGSVWGVALAFVLRRTRFRYYPWVGTGAGLVLWLGTLGFANLAHIIPSKSTDLMSLMALLIGMEAFGLVFVLFARIWKPLRIRTGEIADEK